MNIFQTLSLLILSVCPSIQFMLPSCPSSLFMDKCFIDTCNPEWFTWMGGCQLRLSFREPKKKYYENQDFYSFINAPNSETSAYIYEVGLKLQKFTYQVYKYYFAQDSPIDYKNLTLKDSINSFSHIIREIGFNNSIPQRVSQVKQKIIQFNPGAQMGNSFSFLEGPYTEIWNTLQLIRQNLIDLKKSKTFDQDQIININLMKNLYMLDSQLTGILQVYQKYNDVLSQFGYFTFELCAQTAIFHIDVLTMLAVGEQNKQNAEQFSIRSKQIAEEYMDILEQFFDQAQMWRKDQISTVNCDQGFNKTCEKDYFRCPYTTYYWYDNFTNLNVTEGFYILAQSTSYNFCWMYGELTNGKDMRVENEDYKNDCITEIVKDYLNFRQAFNDILEGIIQPVKKQFLQS